jgi:hypothetical protein
MMAFENLKGNADEALTPSPTLPLTKAERGR